MEEGDRRVVGFDVQLRLQSRGEAIAGVLREGGSARLAATKRLAESVGGTLESFYFAFGSADFYAVADLPGNATALTIAATVGAAGSLSHLETVVLVPAEEADAISQRSADYRPPGS